MLAMLMGALTVNLLAQWPVQARAARLDPSIPLDARMAGALMGTLFVLPILVYALAGLVTLIGRWVGRPVEGADSRLAVIWALVLTAPLMLIAGAVQGAVGPGAASMLPSAVCGVAFVSYWALNLRALARD